MAIALDQASLGTVGSGTSATTIAFTTTATVAANGFIVATFGWADKTVTLSSVAGGGLSWTVDAQDESGAAFDACGMASAQAPSGLASGTTITATLSATVGGRCGGGVSFTGVATSSPVDTSTHGNDGGSGGTAWTTGNITIAAGSVLVSVAWAENATGSTAVSGSEAFEARDAPDALMQVTHYRIEPSGGSVPNAGTWDTSTRWVWAATAYKVDASAAAAPTMPPAFQAIPFMKGPF